VRRHRHVHGHALEDVAEPGVGLGRIVALDVGRYLECPDPSRGGELGLLGRDGVEALPPLRLVDGLGLKVVGDAGPPRLQFRQAFVVAWIAHAPPSNRRRQCSSSSSTAGMTAVSETVVRPCGRALGAWQ